MEQTTTSREEATAELKRRKMAKMETEKERDEDRKIADERERNEILTLEREKKSQTRF